MFLTNEEFSIRELGFDREFVLIFEKRVIYYLLGITKRGKKKFVDSDGYIYSVYRENFNIIRW